jgi:hypothetical protein
MPLLGESPDGRYHRWLNTMVSSGTGLVANIDANKTPHPCKW